MISWWFSRRRVLMPIPTGMLGVFYARVLHTGSQAINYSVQSIKFLWVRWFGIVPGHKYGFNAARLLKVGFVPEMDD
ncbi:hypothetical protein PILCRDRAFT_797344 [Piloderma croceum F 1598]|uniref:Uncharacterized protein n=1 Tax=Piloderma croceum (strain F 1598) TaxID=765440 RepID=A0A0C3EV99_PILCF|nr:hypothetical protein PILCRDRAFT_797344 [Piloderma croceum F 1598]